MTDADRKSVEDLIHLEASLLDDCEYDAWVAMFTQDCLYWVPVAREMDSPRDGPSHFRDDRQVMKVRTHRLLNPRAFGAEPSPRTVHVISGIRIREETADEIIVSSSQIMLEYRNRGQYEDDIRTFGGRVTHRLIRADGGLKIAEKRIDLINADSAFNAMVAPL